MNILSTINHSLRRLIGTVIGPVIGISLIVYIVYHAIQGNHGFIAHMQLQKEIEVAKAALAVVSDERARLERRVHLLHPESLDPDMLEERARIMLGYAHPDDIVIIDRPADMVEQVSHRREPR